MSSRPTGAHPRRPRRRGPGELADVVEEVETDFSANRRRRPRSLHADLGGPPRPAAYVPARAGLPARGAACDPRAAYHATGTRQAHPHRLRLGGRARRQGTGRAREPDLRRGPSRRRAGREGLGRRPAHRGRGGGVPRRRRRPRRAPARPPPRTGPQGGGAGRPPGAGLEGEPDRRLDRAVGGRQARADRRPPLHRHRQAVKPSRPGGSPAWPDVPRSMDWKHGTCQLPRLAAPRPGGHRPRVEARARRRSAASRTST